MCLSGSARLLQCWHHVGPRHLHFRSTLILAQSLLFSTATTKNPALQRQGIIERVWFFPTLKLGFLQLVAQGSERCHHISSKFLKTSQIFPHEFVASQGALVPSLGTMLQGPENPATCEQTQSAFSWSLGSVGDGRRREAPMKEVTMHPWSRFLREGLPDCLG